MPLDTITSAFSFRTSTTARRAGTTARGESDALSTRARPMRVSLAARFRVRAVAAGREPAPSRSESHACNLAEGHDGSARSRCLELRTGAARGVRRPGRPVVSSGRLPPPPGTRPVGSARLRSSYASRSAFPVVSGNLPSFPTVEPAETFGRSREEGAAVRWWPPAAKSHAKSHGGTRWRFDSNRTGSGSPRSFHEIETNVERVVRGKHSEIRLALVALIAEGHLLIEDVPGRRQDHAGQGDRALDRLLVPPHPVHARPAAHRRHRRERLQPGAAATSSSSRAPSSPTSCWATRSTAPAPRRSRRCWSAWRSGRSPSTPRPTRWARRSWSSPRRTRSSTRARIPLPEAQLDRFMLRLSIGYPTNEIEAEILASHSAGTPLDGHRPGRTTRPASPR